MVADTLLSLTKQGDHILSFVELYGPTRHLVRRTLGKFGVTHTLLSIDDLAGIERVLAATPDAPGDLREPHQSDQSPSRTLRRYHASWRAVMAR